MRSSYFSSTSSFRRWLPSRARVVIVVVMMSVMVVTTGRSQQIVRAEASQHATGNPRENRSGPFLHGHPQAQHDDAERDGEQAVAASGERGHSERLGHAPFLA